MSLLKETPSRKETPSPNKKRSFLLHIWKTYSQGIVLTLVLALVAHQLASLPFLSIVGTLIIAIMLGMGWRAIMPVPSEAQAGITFSTKKLLRLGIILMGLRLDLQQIWAAGSTIISIDILVIAFTLIVIYAIGRWLKLSEQLTILIAVGTAICGAAAILAVAPLIRAKEHTTALAVSLIALLGTIGTLVYSFLYPLFPYDSYVFGVFVGSTLHELAHVIAASEVGGTISSDMAILVKLGRVALLIPVAIIIGYLYNRKYKRDSEQTSAQSRWSQLPVPWFIIGFLAMSGVNTLNVLTDNVRMLFIQSSTLFLAMAMVGLGLGVNFRSFRDNGTRGFVVCLLGSIALAVFGLLLMFGFYR